MRNERPTKATGPRKRGLPGGGKEHSPGRPRIAVGLDVGGTKILGGLVEEGTGRVLVEERFPTPSNGGAAGIIESMIAAVSALASSPAGAPIAVGVSSAGHVDWETGDIVDGTPNIPGWAGTPLGARLQSATGLDVCCDNDGNAAAWGEAWAGAGRDMRALVAVTLGTGFGAGIYDRGHLLRGAHGGGAEIGHLILVPDGRPCNCGQAGCVEAYVSGTALGKQAKAIWGEEASSRSVFSRARQGDAMALSLLDEFSRHLALVCVSLFNLCDPERILIGGGIAAQGDLFMPQTKAWLARLLGGRRWSVDQVAPAALGERAGMVGAAGQALARFGGGVPVARG